MSSLYSSLEAARSSLAAQQTALQVTSNNIANVNTPGYHRQRAILETTPPEISALGPVGTGVTLSKVESVRDRFLEIRIAQAHQTAAAQDTISTYLRQIESVLGSDESGIQEGITRFFNSFSALATDPTSSPLRYGVVSAGENLAATFRNAAQQFEDIRDNANNAVDETVGAINALTERIAGLNLEIATAEFDGTEASGLRDQRSVAVNDLAALVDIRYHEAEDGTFNISTAGGYSLVTAGFAHALETTAAGIDGMFEVTSGAYTVTDSIRGGKLGGLLEIRDRLIPAYQQQLDTLAESIISEVNTAHNSGTDLQSPVTSPAVDFFNPAAAVAGAAAGFSVNGIVAGDVRYIASGLSGSPGDNANALAIAELAFDKVLAGGSETFAEAFASLQFRVGTDGQSTEKRLETQNALLVQLENSRDAISGVSLDEESIDLIRFQRAYQAAARFINIIDQLTEEMIQLVG
jgi:flagellar hook-associated protein 1 FlgK